MGVYDTIKAKCPKCDEIHLLQSKSGWCILKTYELEDCPNDVLWDANRHAPFDCDCGCIFEVDLKNRKTIEI